MIENTIQYLEKNNRTYWGLCSPVEKTQYQDLLKEMAEYIQDQSSSYTGVEEEWQTQVNRIKKEWDGYSSHGEFLGALTDLSYYLKEGHSMILPQMVLGNENGEGAPLIQFLEYRSTRIGASLVVGKNRELLVADVVEEGNIYHLSPGDHIFAVNGVPWELWRIPLEESGLPIIGSPGADPTARALKWQKSLMMNITLFQTFSVRKTDGSVELVRIDPSVQPVPIPSFPVSLPAFSTEIPSSHRALQAGILKDRNIAYIHIDYFDQEVPDWGGLKRWDPDKTSFSREFLRIIESVEDTEGLILDLRGHSGGLWQVSFAGLSRLVENPAQELFFRAYAYEAGDLVPAPLFEKPFEREEPDQVYPHPIVVLCDADTISGGDFFAAICAEYPRIRVMGEAHNGSFLGVEKPQGFHAGELWAYAFLPRYLWTGYHGSSLLRENFLDEQIFYDAKDLAEGQDTYLLRALEWIDS